MSAEFGSCLPLLCPLFSPKPNRLKPGTYSFEAHAIQHIFQGQKWIIRLAHVLWGIVNKHTIQWVLYPQWIYIFPALSFEVLLICKRKHRAIIINPLDYKGPASSFNGTSLHSVNCCGGAGLGSEGVGCSVGTISFSAGTVGSTKRLWSSWSVCFCVCLLTSCSHRIMKMVYQRVEYDCPLEIIFLKFLVWLDFAERFVNLKFKWCVCEALYVKCVCVCMLRVCTRKGPGIV